MKPPKIELDGKAGLAKRLEMSRTTLDGYLNQENAPKANPEGLYDVLEVTRFIAANPKSERTAVKADDDLKALKRRELRLKCEKLQTQIERERGLLISLADAEQTVEIATKTIMSRLRRILETELPPKLVGLSVIEIAERMKATDDQIAHELGEELTWQESKP